MELLVAYSVLCSPSRLGLSGVQVITKQIDGHKCEPYEEAVIEVPEEHVGPVVDMLGQRKGQMLDLVAGESGGLTRSDPPLTPLAASASLGPHCGLRFFQSLGVCHAVFGSYRLAAPKHCQWPSVAAENP